jgi:phosphomannomutase
MIYLFDVDGTLTEPRKPITDEDRVVLTKWLNQPHVQGNCYIVTGSDKDKIKEQLTDSILDKFAGKFYCLGNYYVEGKEDIKYINEFPVDEELLNDCEQFINGSRFKVRYGNHIEKRVGMINVSVCGRDIPVEKRHEYSQYDYYSNERKEFAERMNEKYREKYEFSVGGEISIDVSMRGKDKSQVLRYLIEHKQVNPEQVIFFGDKCLPGGNDHRLAYVVEQGNGTVYQIREKRETYALLSNGIF